MTDKYVYNDQPIGAGERVYQIAENGKRYVRTGVLEINLTNPERQTITYRLREVYDSTTIVTEPQNHAPTLQGFPMNVNVEAKK